MSFKEFIDMGGYGFYVWTSYGICLLVLMLNVIVPIVQSKQFLRQQALKQKRQSS
jgi:heme exporter protein D